MVMFLDQDRTRDLKGVMKEVQISFFSVYCWELLISLWFEYRLCSRQLQFKWPFVFYFLTRYFGFGAILGNLILDFTKTPVNCRALVQCIYLLGNFAVFFASCNLMIRATIIWSYRWFIVIPLAAIATGQLLLLLICFRIKGGSWDPDVKSCVDFTMDLTSVGIYSIYTAAFDFIILITSVWGLKRISRRSSFADALCKQGITYFAIVFTLHTVIAISVFVTHNLVYSMFTGTAAITISPVLSCRMVRSTLKVSVSYDTDRGWWWREGGSSRATTETEGHECQFSTNIDLESPNVPTVHEPKGSNIKKPRAAIIPLNVMGK